MGLFGRRRADDGTNDEPVSELIAKARKRAGLLSKPDLLVYVESTAMSIDAAVSAYRNTGRQDYVDEAHKLAEQLAAITGELASR